jgi:hypothetical protein
MVLGLNNLGWSLANGFPKHFLKKLGTNRLNRRSKLVEFSVKFIQLRFKIYPQPMSKETAWRRLAPGIK